MQGVGHRQRGDRVADQLGLRVRRIQLQLFVPLVFAEFLYLEYDDRRESCVLELELRERASFPPKKMRQIVAD